ncbi:MAG TPA: SDR family oxidoreductase [Alphaproteobacteria bacterium]|nr:SDR family oxidoreductase [Alphaproteobacteria bacterium]HQS94522.1 SDR family oxidoreductase [Alphaproteobacteria bacterium]
MNKIVLLVGATSMIGRACARVLSEKNMTMILLGRDSEKLGNLKRASDSADAHVLDVTSEPQIESIVAEVLKTYGSIDAVIYNAGIYPWKDIESLSLQAWRDTLDVTLTGAFLMTKACAKIMKKQRSGKFVFISSLAGETIGVPHMSAYATSKAGLNGFMRTAALELAPFKITANSISPGKVYDAASMTEAEILDKTKPIPLRRFVEGEDIAHMAAFLISDLAKNITGQNFVIDGGQSILGEEGHVVDVL